MEARRPPPSDQDLPLAKRVCENGHRRTPRPLLGVLEGEGVGPEVTAAALGALEAATRATGAAVEVRRGGAIGVEAIRSGGRPLPEEVAAFTKEILEAGGALLCGPGGDRFVYDLRRRFDLFCKVSPIRAHPELERCGPFPAEHVRGVDLLFVRDNAGGVYQGEWQERRSDGIGRVVEHRFASDERQVRRLAEVAARLAATRRGKVTVVVKEGGVPGVSRLWREVAEATVRARGVAFDWINADHAAFRLLRDPRAFDVLLTPNLFGDLLMDEAALLQGTRALACSGNFSGEGFATYQTNHGSAHDIEGRDVANPAGQILALAMLLRESLGLAREARILEEAVACVWRSGVRTFDLAERGARTVGTREFGRLVEGAALRAAVAAPA